MASAIAYLILLFTDRADNFLDGFCQGVTLGMMIVGVIMTSKYTGRHILLLGRHVIVDDGRSGFHNIHHLVCNVALDHRSRSEAKCMISSARRMIRLCRRTRSVTRRILQASREFLKVCIPCKNKRCGNDADPGSKLSICKKIHDSIPQCHLDKDDALQENAQRYTEDFAGVKGIFEGLYIATPDTHVLTHTDSNVVGITTRSGDSHRRWSSAGSHRHGGWSARSCRSHRSARRRIPVPDPADNFQIAGIGGLRIQKGEMADGNIAVDVERNIVKTIEDIAFQTNILALNASVAVSAPPEWYSETPSGNRRFWL